jgi:hypothetical protein
MLIDDKPIGAVQSRNLGSPVAPGEAVEAELDRLIERRSRQKDPDEESELWRESVRAYATRREEEMRVAWCEHHQEQAARLKAVLECLISRHEAEAERYLARREHDSNAEEICEEVEGAGQRVQEPKATPPDEGQEGRPDQQGPTDGHRRRRMGMSENLAEHYALPTPQEEVEDEITEQRSIGVSAHVQSGVS